MKVHSFQLQTLLGTDFCPCEEREDRELWFGWQHSSPWLTIVLSAWQEPLTQHVFWEDNEQGMLSASASWAAWQSSTINRKWPTNALGVIPCKMSKQQLVRRAVSSVSYVGHPNTCSTEVDVEVSPPSSHRTTCWHSAIIGTVQGALEPAIPPKNIWRKERRGRRGSLDL